MTKEEQYIAMRKKFLFERYGNSTTIKERLELFKENQTLENIFVNDKESCAKCIDCGATCCQHYPCVFSPNDFIDITDLDYMRKILDVGLLCISEEYQSLFFIRPRNYDDDGFIVKSLQSPNSSTCVLLSNDGCMLDTNYVPCEGLTLLSLFEGSFRLCHEYYTRKDKISDWEKYIEITKVLADEFKEKKYEKEKITKKDVLLLQRRLAGYEN